MNARQGCGGGIPVAASYIDPFGRLEQAGNRYIRHVSEKAATWLKPLYDEGTLADWAERANLVACLTADNRDREETAGWTVTHPAIAPLTVPSEWCGSMLRDAALATLDLLLEADAKGLTLQDAHPHNIVFEGTRPVFVDLTSIVPRTPHRIWEAYGQFLEFFRNPLLLHADGKGDSARAMLLNPIRGARLPAVYPLLSVPARLRRPGLTISYLLERRIERSPAFRDASRKIGTRPGREVDPRTRNLFLRRLRARIAGFAYRKAEPDGWSGYYGEAVSVSETAAKSRLVDRILRAERPGSVVDMGCNTGRFSMLAAAAGARVLAIDSSDACIERLYAEARTASAAITPIVTDILSPTPGHGFMAGEYPALPQRAVSDGVLCLGLVHHLLVSGRQTEERVADLVRGLARKFAVVELIDPDDDRLVHINSTRPIDYRSERLVEMLGARFSSLDLIGSDRPTRKLAICRL